MSGLFIFRTIIPLIILMVVDFISIVYLIFHLMEYPGNQKLSRMFDYNAKKKKESLIIRIMVCVLVIAINYIVIK